MAKAGKASGKGKNGGKAKGKGKPQAQAGVTFIATAAEKGRQVQVVELDEGGTLASVELQMMSPLLIHCNAEITAAMKDKSVQDELGRFKRTFGEASKRDTHQRSSLVLTSDNIVAGVFSPLVTKIIPAEHVVGDGAVTQVDQVKPLFQMTMFGIVADYCASAGLKFDIATLWLGFEGERDIIAMRFEDAESFYMSKTSKRPPGLPDQTKPIHVSVDFGYTY